jgi:hypothetical protein
MRLEYKTFEGEYGRVIWRLGRRTEFDGIRREMISDWVLLISFFPKQYEDCEDGLTLMTLNNFSEPLTPLILSLWSN